MQADAEHQEHHADLGELARQLAVGDESRRRRTDDDARGEVAHQRREPEPMRQVAIASARPRAAARVAIKLTPCGIITIASQGQIRGGAQICGGASNRMATGLVFSLPPVYFTETLCGDKRSVDWRAHNSRRENSREGSDARDDQGAFKQGLRSARTRRAP